MATNAQVIANKQNALKSTGPQSTIGKETACQNALKHGLLSKELLIHDEKRNDLDVFCCQIYSTLSPQGAVEELLVGKVINAAWRLRRLIKVEASIFDKTDFLYRERNLSELFCGTNGDCLQALSRYEAALERNFYKAIHELQRIQAMRLGQPVMAPIAVEICAS